MCIVCPCKWREGKGGGVPPTLAAPRLQLHFKESVMEGDGGENTPAVHHYTVLMPYVCLICKSHDSHVIESQENVMQ